MSDDTISLVVPVHGCAKCLEELYLRVKQAFLPEKLKWELLLVDDRAQDDPWPIITKLSNEDSRVVGIRLSRNHGQHLAIWAGLEVAIGDWVAVLDCDLQDDPAAIPQLYDHATRTNAGSVIVDRGTWQDSAWRRFASNAFYKVFKWLSGVNLANAGNFGLYSRDVVQHLLQFEEQEVFLPMMVELVGFKRVSYLVDRKQRTVGSSSYSVLKLMKLGTSLVVRFSDRPLKLTVVLGFSIALVTVIVALITLLLWFSGEFSVSGWTSTILSIWFLSGLIIATLGMHGVYLGRVFSEVKKRPRVIVEEVIRGSFL